MAGGSRGADSREHGVAVAAAQVARQFEPDAVIGLGGGSSMDCCKGINFVYSCGGSIHDYHGVGKATSDLLPMIAIPTTAGTGSEVGRSGVVTIQFEDEKRVLDFNRE